MEHLMSRLTIMEENVHEENQEEEEEEHTEEKDAKMRIHSDSLK